MNYIVLNDSCMIEGSDLFKLIERADEVQKEIEDFKLSYVNRAYGHDGWK